MNIQKITISAGAALALLLPGPQRRWVSQLSNQRNWPKSNWSARGLAETNHKP